MSDDVSHYVGDACEGGHEDREVIRFSCPLPPPELRSNSRHQWYLRTAAKQAYSQEVHAAWIRTTNRFDRARTEIPWDAADVTYVWKFCGRAPDKANLGANLKALQDFLCFAPDNGKQQNNCWYLGIVKDDKHIDPRYELERVKTRKEQEVHIVIERRR